MSNRQTRPAGTLLAGFVQCRFQPCSALLPSHDELRRHERTCSYAIAQRPVHFPVQPHHLDTQFSPPNSAQPDTDTDDSGSMTFTPNTSRAPSVSGPTERRRSGVIRTIFRGRGSRGSSTPEFESLAGEAPKKMKKQEKEKHNRGQLGSVLYRQEDFLANYVRWERREQSGGNGNGAGLQANKNTIMRGCESVLYALLHKEYLEGVRNGDLDQRQAWIRSILDNAVDRPPYEGTFLDPGEEELCGHSETKSKECSVHGHADWRQCRREAAARRFERNVKGFCRRYFSGAQ